jgi:quinol monooxygenase YgiN
MQVMIRYRLKPDHVQQGRELIRGVYAEIESVQPAWLRQATFQLDDKVSFVTFAELDDPSRHADMPAFQAYRRTINQLCDEPPALSMLHEVGSYRFI